MMSDHTIPDDVFRDQVWQRFIGRKEPATVEDVANLYRAVLLMRDHMWMLTDVVLNQKKLSFTDLIALRQQGGEAIEIIATGLKMLDDRAPENE